jgi:hypothetical protein
VEGKMLDIVHNVGVANLPSNGLDSFVLRGQNSLDHGYVVNGCMTCGGIHHM